MCTDDVRVKGSKSSESVNGQTGLWAGVPYSTVRADEHRLIPKKTDAQMLLKNDQGQRESPRKEGTSTL